MKTMFVLSVYIAGGIKPMDTEYHYTAKAAAWAAQAKQEQAARNGWNVRILIEEKPRV